jgi:hypothetical protein
MQCPGGRDANLVYVNDKLFHRLESHVVLFFVPGTDARQRQTTMPNKRHVHRLIARQTPRAQANCKVAYSTRGRLIDSSNPSRLIVSISTPI